ncbi:MAG: T9SS type A sorting domain-containing protein [Flavobacteriales bacterium]|nr:MAG: T9SS type A sorting domain-containing protein [Flavobacteriales bacterium]
MFRIALSLAPVAAGTLVAAQTPTSIHPLATTGVGGITLHSSPLGGFIATVHVEDSIDLDPGPATVWVEPVSGFEEAAIVGYDDNGAYLWHKQMSGTVFLGVTALSFTEDGQFYLSGTVSGSGDVDPGPGVAPVSCNCVDGPPGFESYYRTGWYGKYTANGDYIWHEQIGGTLNERGHATLTYSPLSHDVFVFGTAMSGGYPVDFDPNGSTAIITPEAVTGGVGYRNANIYARLDSSGTYQWFRNFGGGGVATRWDNGTDEFFYLTGTSFGSDNTGFIEDHDPGTGIVAPYHPIGTLQDVFASKFDANGDLVWCQFFFGGLGTGFLQNEGGSSVVVDANGDAFVAGVFVSNYPNTPGGSPLSLVPYNGAGSDALLLKLDGDDGSVMWQKHLGSENDDCYSAICTVDDAGRVYITSTYHGTAELNMNSPSVTVTANGPPINNWDGYVACFDGNGAYQWSGTYGGPENDGLSQLIMHNDQLCVAGYFRQTADLDLGPGTQNFTALAQTDPFFACYDLSGLALGEAEGLRIAEPFGVYPNPANELVTLRGIGSNAQVEVFDALGQRIIAARSNSLDVSAWSEGIYFAKWEDRTQRLIIQH